MKKIVIFLFSFTLLFSALPKFLMPDEAFIPHAKLNQNMQIEASVEIAKNIYLYADKMNFHVTDVSGIRIIDIKTPKAIDHDGEMAYIESPNFLISLKKDSGVSGVKSIVFTISYQG